MKFKRLAQLLQDGSFAVLERNELDEIKEHEFVKSVDFCHEDMEYDSYVYDVHLKDGSIHTINAKDWED